MKSLAKTTTIASSLLLTVSYASLANGTFESGKLLVTGGVTQVEGAGGGGLSTWALITGYGSEDGIGANAHHTVVKTNDFTLNAAGVAIGFYDRIEVSYTQQWFDTGDAGGRLGIGNGFDFKQDIIGAKVKLFGDAIVDQDRLLPQVSVGVQFKNASNAGLLGALGANKDTGTDYYIAATKVFLAQSLLVNATARLTAANQFGLLGFGAAGDGGRDLEWEFSAVYLLAKRWVIGADYRTKPNNLAFAREQDSAAAYIAYFPSKNISFTLAAVDLGDIALQGGQTGVYFSTQIGF